MTAVTTPTGIPPASRATRSAAASRLAPISADSGRTRRAFGPTTSRTTCGTTSPTKPISPLIETAAAVIRLARPSRIARSRRTSTPRWAAASSPSRKPLSARARTRIADRRREDDRRGQGELEPRRALEPAEQVEEDLAQVRPRQVHRHGQPGREQRADGVAGQEQARQRGERPGPAEAVDGGDRQERADEREDLDEPELEEHDPDRHEDADRRAERRAGRRAEHVRVGQRVAQDPLERGAGDGQPEPDDHRRQDPRQAQVDHDRLGRRRPGRTEVEPEQAVGEDRHGVGRGDGHAAQADPEDEHDDEGDEPPARSAPGRDRARSSQPAPVSGAPRTSLRVAIGSGRRGLRPATRPGRGSGTRRSSSGWIAIGQGDEPSTRRGPGRLMTTSSAGRIAPFLTAVIAPQPGRLATIAGVVP